MADIEVQRRNPGLVLAETALAYEAHNASLIGSADRQIADKTRLIDLLGKLEQEITAAFLNDQDEVNFGSPELAEVVRDVQEAFPHLAPLFESGSLHKEDASAFKDALNIEARKFQHEIEQLMTDAKYTMEDIRAVMDMIRRSLEALERAIARWQSKDTRG